MTVILRPFAQKGAQFFGALAFVEFDATVSESVTVESDVTSHPVEDGVDITDHVQKKQRQLSLSGIVSNSPMNSDEEETDRDKVLFNLFVAIHDAGEAITVVTGLFVYTNMVISRVSTTRDARSGQALPISIDLTQIAIANQEVVTVPSSVLADRPKTSGTSKKDVGRQVPEDIGSVLPDENATDSPGIYGPPAPPAKPTTGGNEPAPEKDKTEDNRTTLKRIKDSFAGT